MRVTIVLAVGVFASGCQSKDAPDHGSDAVDAVHQLEAAKAKLARIQVGKLAMEAYPMWAADHPGKACPSSADDLKPYLGKGDDIDPWGTPIDMRCDGLPPTARGFGTWSLGPDRKDGTADDIRSWP